MYPLILYSILHLPFHSPYRKSLVCFLSLWVCFFFVIFTNFIFKILHTNDILQYFSFSVWFISLGIILSKSIHVVVNGRIFFFLYFILYTYIYIYIYVYISHILSTHLLMDTGLFPYLGYYKQCCYKHWGTCIFLI